MAVSDAVFAEERFWESDDELSAAGLFEEVLGAGGVVAEACSKRRCAR